MDTTLWVLQIASALLYAASGVMKAFLFDRVSADVPSFGALPRNAWRTLGIVELLCVAGLVVPAVIPWHPVMTPVAAAVLALESLVFVWVHAKCRETGPLLFSAGLGLSMAFLACGRIFLQPIA